MTRPDRRRVAIVWRGEPPAHLPETSRLHPVRLALEAQGITVVPLVYDEARSDSVRRQLLSCGGALVWIDPLDAGRDRRDLDAILREASSRGVWIGSHPDVILRMGTKQVLFDTRDIGWGGDTLLYRTFDDFRQTFPVRLKEARVRVLKQYRGNGGQGVWKVALAGGSAVTLQQATDRDGTRKEMPLGEFLAFCARYFEGEGRLIDQAFQPRVAEGMVRCYMCGSALVGFARQFAAPGVTDAFGIPAAKTMLPPSEVQFQTLRRSLETDWTPKMCATLELDEARLPALWDADFLFGPKSADGEDSFVLCEINASCVTPFPPQAPEQIAQHVARALARRGS